AAKELRLELAPLPPPPPSRCTGVAGMITNSSKESYFPQVIIDGEIQPITTLLNMPYFQNVAPQTAVVDTLVFTRRAIGLTNVNPGTDWFSESGGAVQQVGFRIPSLEELGYASGRYRKKAKIAAQGYAPTGGSPIVELELIEYPLSVRTPIPNFIVSKQIDASGADDFVMQSEYQILPDEIGFYQVDFRSANGDGLRIRAYSIYLMIEKI
ncbi:MAG: hypothetical protein AAF242_18335, partial [Bacteroidota bacterium]